MPLPSRTDMEQALFSTIRDHYLPAIGKVSKGSYAAYRNSELKLPTSSQPSATNPSPYGTLIPRLLQNTISPHMSSMSSNNTVGYVPPSGGRDTVSLIEGCLWTVILGSWSSIHFNLPANSDTRWDIRWRKAKWLLIGILAPECVAFKAIYEWYEVKWVREQLRQHLRQHNEKESSGIMPESRHSDTSMGSTHFLEEVVIDRRLALPARLGLNNQQYSTSDNNLQVGSASEAYSVDVISDSERQVAAQPVPQTSSLPRANDHRDDTSDVTIHYAYFVLMGGIELRLEDGSLFRLNAVQCLGLLERERCALPDVDTKKIKAISKVDTLTKVWACVQSSWFIIVFLTRVATHEPITLLELFTISQILCTIVNYIAWIRKPQGIEHPHQVTYQAPRAYMSTLKGKNISPQKRFGIRVDIFDIVDVDTIGISWSLLVCYVPLVLFGTCHVLGWHHSFITGVERILWRITSIGCLALPAGIVFIAYYTRQGKLEWLNSSLPTLACLYTLCWGYIYVEIFAALRQVPAAVYEDNKFTRFIPHVGS